MGEPAAAAVPLHRRVRHVGSGVLSAVVMVAVLGTALAIGSGVGSSTPPSPSQRASALETRIRCPSCQDISVAQSQASSAVAARRQIAEMVAAGRSDAQIEQYFVDRYGPAILLVPPPSGLGLVVWVVPIAAAVLAVAALGALFWRRQRALGALRAGPP